MAGSKIEVRKNGQEIRRETPPRILICDKLPDNVLDPLRRKGYLVDVKTGLELEALKKIIGDYDAVIVRSETKLTPEILSEAKKLEVIGRAGVGVDNIDVEAATGQGIIVFNTPEANTISAAEHTIALMLSVFKHIPQANQDLHEGLWTRPKYTGTEVKGKILTLIGVGHVGSEVAQMAKGLKMKVVAYDPYLTKERAKSLGIESVTTLEEALEQGDVVSVHVPLNPTTRNLISEKELKKMKPSAILLNVARGGIVNEEALVEALNKGVISGAGIDVFVTESENVNKKLSMHPKIITTPHLGASTLEAGKNVTETVVEQLIHHFEGKPVDGAVNIPDIPSEVLRELQPYIEVATRISSLAAEIARDPVKEIHISYSGDQLVDRDKRPLKAAIIRGVLATVTDDNVNLVNCEKVIKKRGLVITEMTRSDGEYSNLIQVRLIHEKGGTEISGIHGHDGSRVISINGLKVDLPLKDQKHMLLVNNIDRPGMIKGVAGVLEELKINVGDMRVARNKPGGNAMMVIFLDDPIASEAVAAISKIGGVTSTNYIELT